MQKITVDFDESGNPSVSVNGVKGKSCKDLTRALEADLGATVSDTHTAEYQAAPLVGQQVKASSKGGA